MDYLYNKIQLELEVINNNNNNKIFVSIHFPFLHHIPVINTGNQVQTVLPVSLCDCDTAVDYKL